MRLVRGSSLLLVARVVAQATEFGLQLFLLHYLAKADYGAFAYALAIVFLLRAVAVFELPVTLGRFLPMYREQGRHSAVLGGVRVGFAIAAGLGCVIALAVDIGLLVLDFRPTGDHEAIVVLSILVLVVPVQALDILLTSLFATFDTPVPIFIRQAVLGPVLKVGLAVAVVATHATVRQAALWFVAVEAVAALAYCGMFVRLLRQQRSAVAVPRRERSYPVRETVGFAAPLLASTLVWVLMESSDAVLLGHFGSIEDVAAFRAVLVIATLNQGVTFTFALLYTPLLARLYAQGDIDGVRRFYWRSTLWVQVLSFPVFILTFSFATATTTGVAGDRYAGSAAIMAVLAFGYFFHSSLGFNGLTLRVFGKLRYSVGVDVSAAVLNVVVNLALIPRWGAIGAAVGTSGTMVVHNVLKQYGLWRYTGISLFDRAYLPAFAGLFAVAFALLALQTVVSAGLMLATLATALVAIALIWSSRRALEIDQVFPEVARWPIMRALVEPSR